MQSAHYCQHNISYITTIYRILLKKRQTRVGLRHVGKCFFSPRKDNLSRCVVPSWRNLASSSSLKASCSSPRRACRVDVYFAFVAAETCLPHVNKAYYPDTGVVGATLYSIKACSDICLLRTRRVSSHK